MSDKVWPFSNLSSLGVVALRKWMYAIRLHTNLCARQQHPSYTDYIMIGLEGGKHLELTKVIVMAC